MPQAGRGVLVLGASGYVGSHVLRALETDGRYRPVGASRRSAYRLDATRPADVARALQGIDFVVNCIAGTSRATEMLCRAAKAGTVRRIVHMSSMAVYGDATGEVNETSQVSARLSRYGMAKADEEAAIQRYVRDGGDAIILRPACIFGRSSPQWTTRIAALLHAGRLGDLGAAGDGWCNLTYIDDLTTAVMNSLEMPLVGGSAFNIVSHNSYRWNEFLIAFAKALGATPIRRISARRLRLEAIALAPILSVAEKILPTPERITPSLVSLLRQDIRIDGSLAERVLSVPKTHFERIIATAAWEVERPKASAAT